VAVDLNVVDSVAALGAVRRAFKLGENLAHPFAPRTRRLGVQTTEYLAGRVRFAAQEAEDGEVDDGGWIASVYYAPFL
jgi:hypothetical protein